MTELLWAGSKHNISMLGSHGPGPPARLRYCDRYWSVRVLGSWSNVLDWPESQEACLPRRVQPVSIGFVNSVVSGSHSTMDLRQPLCMLLLRLASTTVTQSTLCGAPKTVTDKLQRVLNAAARVVRDTRKFDRGLTSLLHGELHWLDVPARYNELVTVCRTQTKPRGDVGGHREMVGRVRLASFN